ncbi:MAG: peptidylprolyl isomerase [Gammaproteobacteria bacterium]|nr:peptidylprolyl isomerase [Gammaproteobacteria bacterium]
MKNSFYKSALLSACVILSGTQQVSAKDTSAVIAVVNDTEITEEVFGLYGKKRVGVRPGEAFPEEKRKELLNELINRELIFQDAKKNELDKNEFVLMEIEEQIRNVLTRVRINKLLEDTPPSEAMLKTVYQTQIVDPASQEYKARHILLKDIDTAKAVIIELNKGANFEKLAEEKSTGPSASVGGDLGWFSPNQMVKAFSEATAKLKKGAYTRRPIETRFGWHVIKLENSRKVEPPPYKSVEAQVLKVAQNKIINKYLDKLKANAKIELK